MKMRFRSKLPIAVAASAATAAAFRADASVAGGGGYGYGIFGGAGARPFSNSGYSPYLRQHWVGTTGRDGGYSVHGGYGG